MLHTYTVVVKMKKLLLPIAVLILVLSTTSVQATLVDDGYHFTSSVPNPQDYVEWWFFDFVQPDIKGVIQYSLWDPSGLTSLSFGLMFVSIQRDTATTIDILFPIPWEYIMTSQTSADLVMGPETITVKSGAYALKGYVADEDGNEVSWKLHYVQEEPSLYGIRNLETAPNEAMNWYVQMPSATVYGTIVVNGETFHLHGARGYHDHNWGSWQLSDTVWNWFQTSTPSMATIGYDFYALNTGQITVQSGTETITFDKSQYKIVNQAFKPALTPYLPVPLPIPTKTTVFANNGEYILMLNIHIDVGETSFIAREYSNVLWLVAESNAVFSGFLAGDHCVMPINSVGFREYAIDIPLQ